MSEADGWSFRSVTRSTKVNTESRTQGAPIPIFRLYRKCKVFEQKKKSQNDWDLFCKQISLATVYEMD